MDASEITRCITALFTGVGVQVASRENGAPEIAWGDIFYFADVGGAEPPDRKFPFATIVTKDYGEFDCASNLNRPGVFRLNIGISKQTFAGLFPEPAEYDFTALDRLLPHPVYGKMYWVCVLNPSAATFEVVRPLLAEAFDLAAQRNARRTASPEPG
jgi:hypothetical protein